MLLLLLLGSRSCAAVASAFEHKTDLTTEVLKNAGQWNGGGGAPQLTTPMLSDASVVRFEPRSLSLKGEHTCVPRWEQVEIVNVGEETLTIEDVTSSHTMFHPSLPKSETLRRHESSKFQILFLAQAAGTFEGKVFVRTNVGLVPYAVKAKATDNPYKVEAIVGAKVLVGQRFNVPVSVYNPSDVKFHMREVFTTETFLHLALPDRLGDGGGRAIDRPPSQADVSGVWTIQPKQQRTVIHVSFMSQVTGKFLGFVHLKTDLENLLVPVEIAVSPVTRGGVHVTPELVDFQTLVSPLQSRSTWLTLTNLNSQPIELLSLYDPKQDPNLQITGFDQKGIDVVPGATVRFARVTYHGGEEGFMHGKLQLIINDTESVSATLDIPYKARVLYGSLGFMNDKTKFQSTPGRVTSTMRSIMISNNFSVPILIHTAKIDDPNFKIRHFKPNSLLAPKDAVSLMHVEFTSNGTSALYTRDLELSTNVTSMKIPLQVYHGKLHCQVDHRDLRECSASDLDLNLGTISVTESRRKHINITNLNPVNMTIESIAFTHATVNLLMEGVWGPKGEQVRGPRPVPRNLQSKRVLTLPPGHRLALAVEVVAMEAGTINASVAISTRRKEHILLSVRYESVLGSLAFLPAKIRFEASFPGRVQSRIVAARSTFERDLQIKAVRSTDSRIIPELLTRSLSPLARTEVAHIHYDPSKSSSPDDDYMPQNDEVEWDMPLTEEIVERWTRRQKMWNDLGVKGQTDIEATLFFDTNIVRGASLAIRASLTKPSIAKESFLSFDLTQVGTSVTQVLLVHNPCDTLLAVQLVFSMCDIVADGNATCDAGFKLAQEAHQVVYVKPHSDLAVGPIIFEPQQHTAYNTTLYVRNNLTMLHPVKLSGIGGSGRLVFVNGALDFNLTAHDLGEEAPEDDRAPRQRIAIAKSFVATNDCELPVEVTRFDINGVSGCAGFGFQIHDCKPFTVAPHESVSFLVSFTPDFAASRWEQSLRLHTPSGILAVPLRAFVPPELLPQLVDRAPFLGESEASVKQVVTVISITLCAFMFVVVVGDSLKLYRGTASNGHSSCQESPSDMISFLSWSSVNSLTPTSWHNARGDSLVGSQRTRRTESQDMAQRQDAGDPNERTKQSCVPPPGPSKAATNSEKNLDLREDRHEEQHGTQQPADLAKHGAAAQRTKEETKARTAEEAQRKASADVARTAAEELERRIREEEQRRKAHEAEEEEQMKAALEESRKAEEERRRAVDREQAQAKQSASKADAAKAKERAKKKDPPAAPAQPKEAPADKTPRPKACEKPHREEREKAQREERERERLVREERERHAREDSEQSVREERERLAREERDRQAREEREKERERNLREERERQGRDERERAAREERDGTYRNQGWQAKDERDKTQRDKRTAAPSPDNDRKGSAQSDSAPTPSPKRRDVKSHGKGKEGPPNVPPKPKAQTSPPQTAHPQGKSNGGGGSGGSKPSHASHQGASGGGGPPKGSAWADPKLSFQPQSHWVNPPHGEGDLRGGKGKGPPPPPPPTGLAPDMMGDPAVLAGARNVPPGVPPPPSQPPPPAPRVPKGVAGKGGSEAASPTKAHLAKHAQQDAREQAQHEAAGRAARALQQRCMLDLPPRHPTHASMPGMPGDLTPVGPGFMSDRSGPAVAPIGPASAKPPARPAASLLPDQEFIPINTDSPSIDRMQVFGDNPFASSLFSSPFAMFGPVTSYGGDNPGAPSGSGLLADLHADSQVVENAAQRRKNEPGM